MSQDDYNAVRRELDDANSTIERLQRERDEARAELRKRPYIDGPDIVQGEHEADMGIVGYTLAAVAVREARAREEQREACALYVEQQSVILAGLVRSTPLTSTPYADALRALRLLRNANHENERLRALLRRCEEQVRHDWDCEVDTDTQHGGGRAGADDPRCTCGASALISDLRREE